MHQRWRSNSIPMVNIASRGMLLWGLLACCAILPAVGWARAIPALVGHVNDEAGLLDDDARARLEAELTNYEQQTGHQFAILIIPSLEGDPVEDFSIRVVEAWKLGRKKKDDGLLLLIVPKDRQMRIEVGYGLEGDIPDAIASRVIRDVLTPAFRKEQFAAGITQGMHALMQAGRGEQADLPPEDTGRGRRQSMPLPIMIIIGIFIFVPMLLRLLGIVSPYRSGRGPNWPGGGFGGGFGGGGFGGGGGWSGGGGGFGGGGSSGKW